MKKLTIGVLLSVAASHLHALSLDKDNSTLHFVSVKNNRVAELMSFENVSGSIDDESGKFAVTIGMSSIASGIPIRNERMRKFLFEIDRYPQATFSGRLSLDALKAMSPGEQQQMNIQGEVSIHGEAQSTKATVIVTKRADGAFSAVTATPVLVDAAAFGMGAGVDKLREIAGLQAINTTVPVMFDVIFR